MTMSNTNSKTHPPGSLADPAGNVPSMQRELFGSPVEISATCPTCRGTDFNSVPSTDKFRCTKCGWMVKLEGGRVVDAIDWQRAGRSLKKRRGGK